MNEEIKNEQPELENQIPTTQDSLSSKEGTLGPIVGSVIVIIVLILGGIFFWTERAEKVTNTQNETSSEEAGSPVPTSDSTVTELETQSEGDEIADIQADIANTNLDNLDEELGAIEAELNAEVQ